ncbi:MAG: hypothetical protein G01um101433_347 [Parcubacteria group bacterium Gr01-1014_33]|nr:MAG: hypothetical protein G01um101433_347 [Parcubacteria group bacterium Gr01-1014_33]
MKFGLEQLKKISSLLSLRRIFRLGRKQGILFGAYTLLLLFVVLLTWDGFLFYTSVIRSGVSGKSPALPPKSIVSSRQFDEVITLLDQRKHALENILNEGVSATTTPVQ